MGREPGGQLMQIYGFQGIVRGKLGRRNPHRSRGRAAAPGSG